MKLLVVTSANEMLCIASAGGRRTMELSRVDIIIITVKNVDVDGELKSLPCVVVKTINSNA